MGKLNDMIFVCEQCKEEVKYEYFVNNKHAEKCKKSKAKLTCTLCQKADLDDLRLHLEKEC